VLTASVLFPAITGRQILEIIVVCVAASLLAGAWVLARARRALGGVPADRTDRENWRMPPLAMLSKPVLSTGRRIGLTALRAYLAIAMILVIVKIVQVAIGH
jgi:1-acyl-sn-glycerol-3-phosphate acyltransferase